MPILSCGGDNQFKVSRSGRRSSQASVKSDFQRCSSALISGVAKNADLGTQQGLARRRSLSCSFVYLKGSKIFSGLRNFVSKMSDRIKFQNRVFFNYFISLKLDYGCVRLGNPDLDFPNLNPDFPIEHEIRKRISPPRNPSSGWISIKKSKSGFLDFPFCRSSGKSEKGFAKLFS